MKNNKNQKSKYKAFVLFLLGLGTAGLITLGVSSAVIAHESHEQTQMSKDAIEEEKKMTEQMVVDYLKTGRIQRPYRANEFGVKNANK